MHRRIAEIVTELTAGGHADLALQIIEKDALAGDKRAMTRMWDAYYRGGYDELYRATKKRIRQIKNPEKMLDLVQTLQNIVRDNTFNLTREQAKEFASLLQTIPNIEITVPDTAVRGRRGRKRKPLDLPIFNSGSKYDGKINREIRTIYEQMQERGYGKTAFIVETMTKWLKQVEQFLLTGGGAGIQAEKRLERIWEMLVEDRWYPRTDLWKALKKLEKLFTKINVFDEPLKTDD